MPEELTRDTKPQGTDERGILEGGTVILKSYSIPIDVRVRGCSKNRASNVMLGEPELPERVTPMIAPSTPPLV